MVKTATKRPASPSAARSAAVSLAHAERVFGVSLAVARRRYDSLTPREREVAHWMAAGRSNTRIADELGISPKTLDIHRANVKEKLGAAVAAGVANAVNLVRLAEAAGA